MQESSVLLVVEDEIQIRELVAAILEDEGYRVIVASNGEEAMKALLSVEPGLILLDLQMPRMTGWDFMKALQQNKVSIPIIVMSAQRDKAKHSLELGAADYLDKPFELDELLFKVAEYVKPVPN